VLDRLKRALVPLFVLAVVGSGALAACSDEHPPVADTSSSSSSAGGPADAGGASVDAPSSETGSRPNPERLCEPLPQAGFEVAELSQRGAPPEGYGGTINGGTYVLTSLDAYGQPPPDSDGGEVNNIPPTGNAARVTLYVTSDALRFVEARGKTGALPSDSIRGFSFKTVGTSIELTPECPTPGAKTPIPYTAGPNGIVLYADATHREFYTRQ
jgi:hypothetical protein